MNYLRIRDALNRTRTAFSDGVTVLIRRPDTASVRDGLADNDIDFQQPVDTLSANWDSFGDALSTLPSDHIVRLGNINILPHLPHPPFPSFFPEYFSPC